MAIHYSEFDTTAGSVVRDLRAAILTNPDWTASAGYETALATTSANANAGTSSLTFTSGSIPAAVTIGSRIRINTYASGISEYRDVTNVTATAVTISPALTTTQPSGTGIFWGSEVVRATTTRGASMVVDLTGAAPASIIRLALGVYGGWTNSTSTAPGAATGGTISKYIQWRNSTTGAAASMPVHVVVSSSKDHLYISVEGPRGSEPNTESATSGSARTYFFIADLVPYSTTDTVPTVVCGGSTIEALSSSVANRSYVVNISKSLNGNKTWIEGKLLTLNFPTAHTTETVGAQRFTVADDQFYLSPYVVSVDDEGFRGRLNNLYFAGFNAADNPDGVYPMAGAEVDYSGITYKFSAISKGNGSQRVWGPLGAVENAAAATYWRSPIVAIPIA